VRVSQFAGLNKVAEIIRRFGINENVPLVPSMVLGAIETTLSQMTIAYGIIANGGKYIEPHFIELIKDRKGNVIYKRDYTECPECKNYKIDVAGTPLPPGINKADTKIITDEATSYQVTSLLMGGIQRGTSVKAKHLTQIIAGKTGTTNKAKDTWFMGYTPKIVVGTYIGYDSPKSLGNRVSGATIALPVFVDFMKNGYGNVPPIEFPIPDSIRLVSVDYETGLPSTGKGSIVEAFKVNSYDPLLDSEQEKLFNPFDKIQGSDSSEEYY
jgi:penicillin-binding protein 1A